MKYTCDGRIDQSFVDLLAVLPTQAQACKLSRHEVFNQYVRSFDQLPNDLEALRGLEVDSNRTLVPVDSEEISRLGRKVGRCSWSIVRKRRRRRMP
jgi:hypothetical protein